MKTYSYSNFSVTLDEPIVVLRGRPYSEVHWGPYQFPILSRSKDGLIRYTCNGPRSSDSVDGYEGENIPFGCVSADNGDTWLPLCAKDEPIGVPMKNGHYFIPPKAKNGYKAEWLSKYKPDYVPDDKGPYNAFPNLYDADNIPEYANSTVAYDYDPQSGKTVPFEMKVNWPHLSMNVYYAGTEREMVYPFDTLMGMMGHYMSDKDGKLYFCTYQDGFSAETGELAFCYTVKLFESEDNGRTWNYLSEFLSDKSMVQAESKSGFEGLCEPFTERMPDGSVIILMRTGSGCPSYIARSEDNCKTWSKPQIFDKVGVLPQLLTLKCGVTLASYGRPGVFLRATSDKSGIIWEKPIDLEIAESCCYTSMLAIDDTTALVAYSDFKYPDTDGIRKKTLLVRKIKINLYC